MATLTESPAAGRGLGALLVLSAAEELGPGAIDRLLTRFGTPERALAAACEADELSAGQREGVRRALAGRTPDAAARAAEAKQRDVLPPGARWLTCCDRAYPEVLRRLACPPAVVWLDGPLPLATPHCAAIVGTRRATRDGLRLAYEVARDLAERGVRVVSGLAAGIDAAAHRGALDAGGETVAVLGCGIDRVYPAANADLYERVRAAGLLVSEFPPGTRPARSHFPRRNRIVAALAHAVLVVEAGEKSGALITAHHALDIGLDVAACPGSPLSVSHVGSNGLLRDGATLVTDATDVCALLGDIPARASSRTTRAPAAAREARDEHEASIVGRLALGPATLGELSAGREVGVVSASLAHLEIDAVVRGLPGGRFELVR